MSSNDTIAQLKEAILAVTNKDYSAFTEEQPLNLDSINRISLIVELEAVFDVEIDSETLEPEVFDTLGMMKAYIDSIAD